jgi:hypothetical protein
MHQLADVGKSVPPLLKAALAVTTRSQEKLATAKISTPCSTPIEVKYVEHVQPVVPMQQVNNASSMISEVKKADVVMANISKNVVEEAETIEWAEYATQTSFW